MRTRELDGVERERGEERERDRTGDDEREWQETTSRSTEQAEEKRFAATGRFE